MKISNTKAFTLLELAIVLLIIGMVVAGGLTMLVVSTKSAQVNATVARMEKIEAALLNYSITFGRLPCPSSLTIAANAANYGVEAAYKGTCTGGTPAANFSSGVIVEGGVPTRALQLPDDLMYDGWGRRFRFAIDANKTATGSIPVGTANCSSVTSITVKDAAGASRSTNGIYSLISHGANGHGGYTKKGVIFNAGSIHSDEQTNCHCDSSAASTTYAPTYVSKLPTIDSTNAVNAFDDIVTFKEGWQLQTATLPLSSNNCTQELYIADYLNHVVRKVDPSGIISTVAGTGVQGTTGNGGAATSARLNSPTNLAFDTNGNLYICEMVGNVIRKLTPAGIISTYAGTGTASYSGDNGPATSATLNNPYGIAVDGSNNLYIADTLNFRVRKVTPGGTITTVAGTGITGYTGDGGAATSARIRPGSIAVKSDGTMYITDRASYVVRMVNTSGIISTIAGNGTQGYSGDGGAATSAQLYYPIGVVLDSSGNIYVPEYTKQVVRKINTSGIISTVAGTTVYGYSGDGGPATSALLNNPTGATVDSSGNLYIVDSDYNSVRKVTVSNGIISRVAGSATLTTGYTGDGGPAISAKMCTPYGAAMSNR